ncbi:hypothetical protein Sjap_014984 [Stephania japonica]|uniref:Uncharacterized protein n=1 Tax=Stephania japonica TaxID=461633 RepID=A0AAP0IIK3_9MAGN
MAVHHSCIFSIPANLFSFPHPPPTPATKHEIPKSFPRKNPKNLNPSLRLVAPADRLVPTRPSRSIVSSPHVHPVRSSRLSVRRRRASRSLSCSLRPSVGRGGLRFSVWSCYPVSPSLSVSPSRRAASFIADISRSLSVSIRIRNTHDQELFKFHRDHSPCDGFEEGIVGSRYRLIIKTNTGDNGRWDDALPEDLVRAAYDRLACTSTRRARTSVLGLCKRRENRNTEVEGPGTDPRSTVADSSETPPSVNDLYLHLHTVNHDRTTFIDTRSERFYAPERRQELTRATPEQSVDDEAVYLNVAGECSKGRVYGLGSVGRKKRRYGTPGASTSQTPDVVPGEFDVVAEQLRKVMNFMHRSWDGHGRNRPSSRNNHHHRHHHRHLMTKAMLAANRSGDPPQQGDNVGRET